MTAAEHFCGMILERTLEMVNMDKLTLLHQVVVGLCFRRRLAATALKLCLKIGYLAKDTRQPHKGAN